MCASEQLPSKTTAMTQDSPLLTHPSMQRIKHYYVSAQKTPFMLHFCSLLFHFSDEDLKYLSKDVEL